MKIRLPRVSAFTGFFKSLVFSVLCTATLVSAQEQRVSFPGSIAPIPTAVAATQRAVQAINASDSMEFGVSLQMRNGDEMKARVARGEIISRAELEASYLPLQADYDKVVNWLTAEGFIITQHDPSRLVVYAQGTVTQVQQSLQVHMVTVTANGGTTYHAADTAPSLPLSIATPVLGINHLQPFHQKKKHAVRLPQTNNAPPFKVAEILKAYNASNLGVTGAGQKIAILIDTVAKNSDLTAFWSANGISQSTANIETINVNGGTLPAASGEETLDEEWSSGIAPGAKIRVYASRTLNDADLDKCLQRLINDLPTETQIHQLSISLGLGETYVSQAQFDTDAQLFATIASAGVSIFVSSGDGGSTPDDQGGSTGPLQVEHYSSDPSVTAVGGTSLNVSTSTGLRTSESVWSGSGGGVSIQFARPSWQVGTGVPAGTKRCVPDVALVADPNTGAYVYLGGVQQYGGTSWSAPAWAGFCALINEARAAAGKPPLGLLNPSVYPLIGTNNFVDVTSGNNSTSTSGGKYAATTGYDQATGVGVPNMANLLPTLVAQLPPVPTITSFTPTSGVENTTVTINGTNFGSASSVSFNGTSATYTVNSTTKITANSPTGATTGQISVTTPSGTATSSSSFTVVAGPPAPSINAFSPAYGLPATVVSISGLNFTGATAVKFNGVAAATFSVNSDTAVSATVPASATTGPISVTTPSGTATSATSFTVLTGDGTPTITAFTPTAGAVGSSVTITGTNFVNVTGITVGRAPVVTYTVSSPTQINASVPSDAVTGPIEVTTGLGTGTSSTDFTVGAASAGSVTISQIYGGGGNTSAVYQNDFVELYNRGTAAVNITGWSVQYASATGTSWNTTALSGTMQSGHYYLVKLGSSGAVGAVLPTADTTNTGVNISGTQGKVALMNTSTAITAGTSSPVGVSGLVDFVGYGAANAYEGSGPVVALSNMTAALRLGSGATDTGDNAADFSTGTPSPRNSSTGGGGTTAPDLAVVGNHTGAFVQGDVGKTYTITVSNSGTAATSGTVTVVDTLPTGLTATAFSGTGWTVDVASLTATRSDVLAAGASYPALTLTVNVAGNAVTSVTNVATVSGGGDSNTANNSSSDVTTINASSGGGAGGGGTGTTGVLAAWEVNGLSGYGASPLAATTTASNVTVGGLTRASGVTTSGTAATNGWGGTNWTGASASAAVTSNQYVTFTVTPASGYNVAFGSVSKFHYRRSGSGATSGTLQYQIGSGAFTDISTVSYSNSSSGGAALPAIDLSGITALQNVSAGTAVTFRIVNYGGTAAGGTWYVYNVTTDAGNDLEITGTVTPQGGGQPATQVRVETAADGSGTVVPSQTINLNTPTTLYAITRTAGNGFVANAAASWSLTSVTGGIVAGDLVPASDNKSAVFTPHAAGSAVVHAVISGLTSTDSGVITSSGAAVPTNPTAVASANSTSVTPGQNVTLTVTVTPGTNPTSSGITVTGDLSAIGGSATQAFAAGSGNTFTYAVTIPANSSTGAKNLSFSISDAQARTATATLTLNVTTLGNITIFHTNDTHARVTPHKWVVPHHTNDPTIDFDDVGGVAYMGSKILSLASGQPDALVLDGGDISEGNPIGDWNGPGFAVGTYGDGTIVEYYKMLDTKLKAISARGGRGLDAMVVGNHDIRDITYLNNMKAASAQFPIISMNICNKGTHTPYYKAYTIVNVNGHKIGIVGYTTESADSSEAAVTNIIDVVKCDWSSTDTTKIHFADYVNDLRNNQGCDMVFLLTHMGHSGLCTPTGANPTPILVDNTVAKLPEVVVSGHWHTYCDTVWQPTSLNYKTIFTEAGSFQHYVGELRVNPQGKFVSSAYYPLKNTDITPDADIASFIQTRKDQYAATNPTYGVDQVIGYTADNLLLDNYMKWWSADEYPWSGNNTAGNWICDATRAKAAALFGQCDLSLESGGGVRSDIVAGPIKYTNIYETFPWPDDTIYVVNMTGQEIWDYFKGHNCDAAMSSGWHVTAYDGNPTEITLNGNSIDLTHIYKVAINNYMYAHDSVPFSDPSPQTSTYLARTALVEYTAQFDSAHPYQSGPPRYTLNTEFSGGYRFVVTMMNDADSKEAFKDGFIRMIDALPETLAHRGTAQVPNDLIDASGKANPTNRLTENEWFRSYLGFRTGVVKPGDIVEIWGKGAFFGGNPEFVDQEGVQSDGTEFKIVGHDSSLSKPTYFSSISAFWDEWHKNHYVKFFAKKTGTSTVADLQGTVIAIKDVTAYAAKTLPGAVGDLLVLTGVPTSESYGLRFRCDSAALASTQGVTSFPPDSSVNALPATASTSSITLSATAQVAPGTGVNIYTLNATADSQIAKGTATANYGTKTYEYVQSAGTGTFQDERSWLKFDLSSLPTGANITSAKLKMYCWKAIGPALPVTLCSSNTDSWTETGINWSNQPAVGSVLDTQTLAAATTNVWYAWDATSNVRSQFTGDKTASFVLKAATEGSTASPAPSYGFEAREYTSGTPYLEVTTPSAGTPVTLSQVQFFYRFSADNTTWGTWTSAGTSSASPYSLNFSFPQGVGYYEFYSAAKDSANSTEPAPPYADASIIYLGNTVNSAPTVANTIATQNAQGAVPFSFSFASNTFADADSGQTLSYSATQSDASALPAWLSFNASTRTFSGTPSNADVGTVNVLVTATDNGVPSLSVSTGFSIVVAAGNNAPVVSNPIADQSAQAAVAFSFSFAANTFSDADASQTLSYVAAKTDGSALPAWLGFNASTLTFSGTPSSGDVGSVAIRVTATDNGTPNLSANTTFTVFVATANSAPAVVNTIPAQGAQATLPFSFTFAANTFADVDAGQTLVYTAGKADGSALPAWLGFDASTRTFSGIPAGADVGVLNIRVVATDNGTPSLSANTTFTITVVPANNAPTVANAIPNQSAQVSAAFAFSFAANTFADADAGQSLSYSATRADGSSLPAWLSFNAASHSFTGTPSAGDVGTVSIRVTATDNGTPNLSVSTTFSVTVSPASVVSFSLGTYSVNQGAGSVPVTISRPSGGAAFAVTLNTVDGTDSSGNPPFTGAKAGVDYTVLSGSAATVNFAAGDTSKTVNITLLPKTGVQSNRRFTVTLSSPTNSTTLGSVASASVQILSNDTLAPTVVITAPAANAIVKVTTDTVAVTGSATDKNGISVVRVSVDGGNTFADATLGSVTTVAAGVTAAFSATVTPVEGSNSLVVKATDVRGNTTTTPARAFTYHKSGTLTLNRVIPDVSPDPALNPDDVGNISPVGAVFPTTANLNPKTANVQLNNTVTLIPTTKAGYIFKSFTTTPVVTLTPGIGGRVSFTMVPDLSVTAEWLKSPYISGAGTYIGLIKARTGTTPSNATDGLVRATLTTAGTFSGSLVIDGATHVFTGAFDAVGAAGFGTALPKATTFTITRAGKSDLVLALAFNAAHGNNQITGSVTVDTNVSDLVADKTLYTAINQVSSDFLNVTSGVTPRGYYTVSYPAKAQTPTKATTSYPQGSGYAVITLTNAGAVTVTSTLADGTVSVATSSLVAGNSAPLFGQMLTPGSTTVKGSSFGGVITFEKKTDSDVLGTDLTWYRANAAITGTAATDLYTTGWPDGVKVDALGAQYDATVDVATALVLSAVDATNGNGKLAFTDGKLTALGVTKTNFNIAPGTVTNSSVATKIPTTDMSYTLSLAQGTGLFSGVFAPNWLNPAVAKPLYRGVILQKGGNKGGYGFFISNASGDADPESGKVLLSKQP